MVNALQKATCKAIVNLFETGTVRGRYDSVVFVEGDAGHLTYGSSQTTLASGNLFLLIDRYCKAKGNLFGAQLSAYLGRLAAIDLSLDTDPTLRGLLHSAGSDPVMQDTQDSFFDAVYWTPAEAAAKAMGLKLPLSIGVVYDSTIHGSWRMMRDRTVAAIGSPAAAGEQAWIQKYIDIRRAWLAGSPPSSLLPKTVYRMDTFLALIAANAWDLALPLNVRGAEISTATLKPTANTPTVASATVIASARLLSLAKSSDVRGRRRRSPERIEGGRSSDCRRQDFWIANRQGGACLPEEEQADRGRYCRRSDSISAGPPLKQRRILVLGDAAARGIWTQRTC